MYFKLFKVISSQHHSLSLNFRSCCFYCEWLISWSEWSYKGKRCLSSPKMTFLADIVNHSYFSLYLLDILFLLRCKSCYQSKSFHEYFFLSIKNMLMQNGLKLKSWCFQDTYICLHFTLNILSLLRFMSLYESKMIFEYCFILTKKCKAYTALKIFTFPFTCKCRMLIYLN